MAFSIVCTNKGCGKLQAPYLDKDEDKVYCSECKLEITNITSFIKNQMRMNKQYRQKERKSFAVKCESCKAEERPKLVNDEIICGSCNKKLDKLSPSFIAMLKQRLKKVDQDV